MAQIESFATIPLQQPSLSYLYIEYSDDEDLQAFVATQNSLAQGYLTWFNQTPLALYTAPAISGPLLDWTAEGIYGISRPILSTETSGVIAGYDSAAYNTIAYNAASYLSGGSAIAANDDIYKRVMTWNMYRGDGQYFTMGWLKNRVNRFLNGPNGSDYTVQENPPSITVSGTIFTVSAYQGDAYTALQLAYANGFLSFPFQYTLAFLTLVFLNDGGVLQMTAVSGYPITDYGLEAGSVWYNGGTVAVVPGVTPNPTAPPVYFDGLTASYLLSLGGGNLPLTDPANVGQLWNNGGLICISAG